MFCFKPVQERITSLSKGYLWVSNILSGWRDKAHSRVEQGEADGDVHEGEGGELEGPACSREKEEEGNSCFQDEHFV